MRKKSKRIVIWISGLITVSIIAVIYFLYSNEAPITEGKVLYGIPYKDNLTLDIYFPTKSIHKKSPVVIYIHGGAWIGGSKELININRINGGIKELREHGYIVFSPQYTLARNGKSPFPDCIIDGYHAINWINQNADRFGLDISNMGIIGESAGAHIAMMLSYADPKDFNLSFEKTEMKFVVDIYGPTNLYDLYHMEMVDKFNAILNKLPEKTHERLDLTRHLFGFDPTVDSSRTRNFTNIYSPVSYLDKNVPPTLIIHGDKDLIVPVDQSLQLKGNLDRLKIDNEIHVLTDMKHAFRGASHEQKSDVQKWISDFIISHSN